jgi:alkanesulfonate monooxygenase SsuD/methylene tetrahydromethanopterin reductase-like flavin-dependent oxidoreductase (luciferase family)
MVWFGVHIGQQNLAMGELRALWRRLDAVGLDWISVWDHFYEAPPAGGILDHFETLTTLGALAADTKRARIGCLVLYPGYRNPALLAKAATTLDHLTNGRFTMGLGGGWHEWEARAHGYDFPAIGERLDMLEESVKIVRGMLTQERTTFEGRHFRVENVSCLPPPVQKRLPIWIGGLGERRTLRLAAREADGWNAAYVSAEEYGRLGGVLERWCEKEARDVTEIERSVNLSFNLWSDPAAAEREEAQLRAQWGPAAERILAGSLRGTPDEAAEKIAAYVEAGAQGVNVALRAPWDSGALDRYVAEVVPELRSRFQSR